MVTANRFSRREWKGGREYIVAPLTLLVPGVLHGSEGPLYYPLEEITLNHQAWNQVPIVVYHPQSNGRNISVQSPGVLERQCVGWVLNAHVRDKLVAEGWFDVAACKRVDPRVLHALETNTPMELSTGLYTFNEAAPYGATHNGKRFTHIARQYKPDHLAVLPDQVGACSLNDGCGVLVNQSIDVLELPTM